jgi:hypothetical protein
VRYIEDSISASALLNQPFEDCIQTDINILFNTRKSCILQSFMR